MAKQLYKWLCGGKLENEIQKETDDMPEAISLIGKSCEWDRLLSCGQLNQLKQYDYLLDRLDCSGMSNMSSYFRRSVQTQCSSYIISG